MSNFLNKFSKENYEGTSLEKEVPVIKKEDTLSPNIPVVDNAKTNTEETTDPTTKIEEETPSRVAKFKQTRDEVTTPSRHVEHETEIDYEYQKKRKRNKLIAIGTGIASAILLIIIIIFMNLVTIKEVVGMTISETKSWANDTNVNLEIEYVFDNEHDQNIVVSQDIDANKKVWKGKTLHIKVSQGANPEEKIEVPDIANMTLTQINEWIDTQKLENAKVTKSWHEEIEKDKVIEFSFEEGITAEDFKRKDQIKINVSKGPEVFDKNIEVPDFKNKTKAEIETWAQTNEVTVTFEEASSDTVETGMIISQSIEAKTMISKIEPITIVVSTGKVYAIPNFVNVDMVNAETQYPDFQVIKHERYHESIAYGGFISQSVAAGTYVKEGETTITVIYSIGRPYINIGAEMSEGDLPSYFYDTFQSKGANITYTVSYVTTPDISMKGTIQSVSKNQEFVSLNEVIHIAIYK